MKRIKSLNSLSEQKIAIIENADKNNNSITFKLLDKYKRNKEIVSAGRVTRGIKYKRAA